jgi:hypothetical protein
VDETNSVWKSPILIWRKWRLFKASAGKSQYNLNFRRVDITNLCLLLQNALKIKETYLTFQMLSKSNTRKSLKKPTIGFGKKLKCERKLHVHSKKKLTVKSMHWDLEVPQRTGLRYPVYSKYYDRFLN